MPGGPKPIVFLLGPSGVGKSEIGRSVQEQLGFLHIEIDRWPLGDGIDIEGIRGQWSEFLERAVPTNLEAEIQRRVLSARRSGAIVTFPSGVVFSEEHIQEAREHRICIAVLYGTGAECLDSFLTREQALKRGLGVDHWVRCNAHAYARFSTPLYKQFRILSFVNGIRRERKCIVRDIDQLIRRCS